MLVSEDSPDFSSSTNLGHELLEIHRSKISLHHAKADYNYPTIRLPHTLSMLAGLPTRIYQTVHKGALAFLMVVSPMSDRGETSADRPSYLHGENRESESLRAHRSFSNRLRELRQCIAVGKITSQYPPFLEIQPQTSAVTGVLSLRLIVWIALGRNSCLS